jgi:L-ascorbate metabolism protein UlaG (beta-lactamase superfamily)
MKRLTKKLCAALSVLLLLIPMAFADEAAPTLLYMGQASIRIVTAEGKVIYIDPYAGNQYDLPADLILVTHEHFDHSAVDRVTHRNDASQIITHKETVIDGIHQIFDLPYVRVEAVEAGFNRWHDVKECVGYVLTFSNGCSVYVTGDTSTTNQMSRMADMHIDYTFWCTDGVFNMGLEEAARCAEMVKARYNIPYHNDTSNSGLMFDEEKARQFPVENLLVVLPGEEIAIQ